MSDPTNEFGFVPDTPEAYQAAEAQAAAENGGQDPVLPASTDDIDSEAPAGDAPAQVPPAPTQPQPTAPVATPVADKVVDARTPIHGLHEDPNTLGLEGVALATKIKLSKEPKVRMMIPFDPGERAGAYRTVILNGYRFDVKKNVMVDLPQSVAALLADAYRITSEVLEENPLNLNNADAGKRSALGL